MTYESHITVDRDHAEVAKQVAAEMGWKFSCIDGDPVLGQKVFAYLTAHDRTYEALRANMRRTSALLLARDVPVIREKIEHIVYDTKTGIGAEGGHHG